MHGKKIEKKKRKRKTSDEVANVMRGWLMVVVAVVVGVTHNRMSKSSEQNRFHSEAGGKRTCRAHATQTQTQWNPSPLGLKR